MIKYVLFEICLWCRKIGLQDGPLLVETPTGQQKGELKVLKSHNHCNFCNCGKRERNKWKSVFSERIFMFGLEMPHCTGTVLTRYV
jgi:hypothetical protein